MPPNDSTNTSADQSPRDLPSQRGETWNDTEAIARHRAMTPARRVAFAIEVTRAALQFAYPGSQPRFDPAAIVAALNEAGVGYVIIGGLAGAAHGVVRATPNVDLLVAPGASLPSLPGLGEIKVFHNDSYAQVRARAVAVEFGPDAIAPVCSLPDLRALKLASGRPRGLIDVAELDELHGQTAGSSSSAVASSGG